MRSIAFILFGSLLLAAISALAEKPALVVFISVDQLRGDMPYTYRDRFGEGGFRRFMDHGTSYTNAHFGHLTTYTASGHATLSTGGNPREHGLVGNYWIDPSTGESIYCVGDKNSPLLGDPSKSGRSPMNLMVETIGDALIDATGGKARVFSIAHKDRSAILMGGHKGKAFWYDSGTGRYVTTTYYYDQYPKWVAQWNKEDPADRYLDATWNLLQDRSTYRYRDQDEREVELTHPRLGETFPHSLEGLQGGALYETLGTTPFGDEMTVSLAKEAILAEKLGQGEVTDFFALGLSATDYIGHAFGPYSLEAEDNILRIDALLADFFAFLDTEIGLDNILLVLSADHGVDGNPPEHPSQQLDYKQMLEVARGVMKDQFGAGEDAIRGFSVPSIYFSPELIAARPNDIAAMESAVAEAVLTVPGVAHAVPRHLLASGNLDETELMGRVLRSFHPERTGNIMIVHKPYHRIYSGRLSYTATHGTPYDYDTHVPVMFAGPGVSNVETGREVGPESIAATLAALLDIDPPAGATGPVLKEVVGE